MLISWALMSWRRKEPGRQQLWYWLCWSGINERTWHREIHDMHNENHGVIAFPLWIIMFTHIWSICASVQKWIFGETPNTIYAHLKIWIRFGTKKQWHNIDISVLWSKKCSFLTLLTYSVFAVPYLGWHWQTLLVSFVTAASHSVHIDIYWLENVFL